MGALDGLVASGLLQSAQPMNAIECDGCEQSCTMPVTVYPEQEDKAGKAFITCDKRDDIGRVQVDFRRMGQWQATVGMAAASIAEHLGFDRPGAHVAEDTRWRIGTFSGRKHHGQLALVVNGNSLALALGGQSIPLVDVLAFRENSLALDKAALIRMVDNPAEDIDTETPGVRRERLKARVAEEKAKGTKAFLQKVAKEESISVSRLKQLINVKP